MDRISWFPVPDEADLPPSCRACSAPRASASASSPTSSAPTRSAPSGRSAWFVHFRMLHDETPGLSAAERDMIANVVSMATVALLPVAHGAALREAWVIP